MQSETRATTPNECNHASQRMAPCGRWWMQLAPTLILLLLDFLDRRVHLIFGPGQSGVHSSRALEGVFGGLKRLSTFSRSISAGARESLEHDQGLRFAKQPGTPGHSDTESMRRRPSLGKCKECSGAR